jgi:hypothetical protein
MDKQFPHFRRLMRLYAGVITGIVLAGLMVSGPVDAVETHPVILMSASTYSTVTGLLDVEPRASWAASLESAATAIMADDIDWDASTVPKHTQAAYARQLAAAYVFRPEAVDRDAFGRAAAASLTALPGGSYKDLFPGDLEISEAAADWATAYDLLAGSGFDFAWDSNTERDARIRSRLATLRKYLATNWSNFFSPSIGRDFLSAAFTDKDRVDNHQVKRYAALVLVALAIRDESGSETDLDTGISRLLTCLDTMTVPGDGGWAEGFNYQLYSSIEYLPALIALEHAGELALIDLPELTAAHLLIPRVLMPDGFSPPIDENEAILYHTAGLLYSVYPDLTDRDLFHWMWTLSGSPVQSPMLPDYLALFDDTPPAAVSPEALDMPRGAVYPESGVTRFRGSWDSDTVWALMLSEHGDARKNGQAHENPDPNTVIMHAFGELMLLDSGYGGWSERENTRYAGNHNLVLVDGAGPEGATQGGAFNYWDANGADATVTDWAVSDRLDYARSQTLYLNTWFSRTLVFCDRRYAIVYDKILAPENHDYTLLWHGNGGGTSGGTFTGLPGGGLWSRGAANVRAYITASEDLTFTTDIMSHAVYSRTPMLTHTVLKATLSGSDEQFVSLLHPTRANEDGPLIEDAAVTGGRGISFTDSHGTMQATSWGCFRTGPEDMSITADSGLVTTNAEFCHVTQTNDMSWPRWFVLDGTGLEATGTMLLDASAPVTIGLAESDEPPYPLTGFVSGTVGTEIAVSTPPDLLPYSLTINDINVPYIAEGRNITFRTGTPEGALRIDTARITGSLYPPRDVVVSDVPNDHGHALDITWSPPVAGPIPITGYRIHRSRTPNPVATVTSDYFTTFDELVAWEMHNDILIAEVDAEVLTFRDSSLPESGVSYYYWLQSVGEDGAVSAKHVPEPTTRVLEVPRAFTLHPPSPNPFNSQVTFSYSLPDETQVTFTVHDILGRTVAVLRDGIAGPGMVTVVWDGMSASGPVASGVYLVRLRTPDAELTGKALLIR